MLTTEQKQRLLANWGEKSETMECFAPVRVYDPLSDWQCFLLALNPENEEDIQCIIQTNKWDRPTLTRWTLYELYMLYNTAGESVEIDPEYRPRRAIEIFRKLNEVCIYERSRN